MDLDGRLIQQRGTRVMKITPNPLEVLLNQMQETASEMARYFRRGFGSAVTNILATTSNREEGIATEEDVRIAYAMLENIEQLYATIPFTRLESQPNFYPIFVIRDLLPKLKQSMDNYFVKQSEISAYMILAYCHAIARTGEVYADNFRDLLEKIKAQEQINWFKLTVTHLRTGEIWEVYPKIQV